MTPRRLRTIVWKHFTEAGRILPWRETTDPYRILVSEVMLQQTQVERVIPYYSAFLKKFPTVHKLANASLSDVLTLWQGLGYNRRAQMLHKAAKAVVEEYDGVFPTTARELEKLPGVGPYTAGAVAAFAYNEDVIIIETNIRTVITYHFFSDKNEVNDTDVLSILEKALPKGQSREWYWALMDYGSALKRSGIKINAKKKGYVKQTAFKGSGREARGAILRALIPGSMRLRAIVSLLGPEREAQIMGQLKRLVEEGLVTRKGTEYRLSD